MMCDTVHTENTIKSNRGLTPDEIERIRRDPPLVMNEAQVAAYLSICPRSVRNLRRRRLIPHVRLGGRILYRLAEVNRALEKLEIRSV
jgi:hypothetical protein